MRGDVQAIAERRSGVERHDQLGLGVLDRSGRVEERFDTVGIDDDDARLVGENQVGSDPYAEVQCD